MPYLSHSPWRCCCCCCPLLLLLLLPLLPMPPLLRPNSDCCSWSMPLRVLPLKWVVFAQQQQQQRLSSAFWRDYRYKLRRCVMRAYLVCCIMEGSIEADDLIYYACSARLVVLNKTFYNACAHNGREKNVWRTIRNISMTFLGCPIYLRPQTVWVYVVGALI